MEHHIVEEIRATGQELISRVKELLREGNLRRMSIVNGKGETLLEVPLTLGMAGVGGAFLMAPVISALATFAFLVHDTRIHIERYPGEKRTRMNNEMKRDDNSVDPYEIDTDFEVVND